MAERSPHGPTYAVHHSTFLQVLGHEPLLTVMAPVTGLPYRDAVAYAEHLAEQPDVVAVHVEPETAAAAA